MVDGNGIFQDLPLELKAAYRKVTFWNLWIGHYGWWQRVGTRSPGSGPYPPGSLGAGLG